MPLIILLLLLSVFSINSYSLTKRQIIQKIKQTMQNSPDKKGIYVDGVGEFWFTVLNSGEYALITKSSKINFKGSINSPTDFNITANVSERTLSFINNLAFIEQFIYIKKAKITLTPKGVKIKANTNLGRGFAKLSYSLIRHLGLRAVNLNTYIYIQKNNLYFHFTFPGTHAILYDANTGMRVFAYNPSIKIYSTRNPIKINKIDVSSGTKIKLSKWDKNYINSKTFITLNPSNYKISFFSKTTGQINNPFGIKNATAKNIEIRYDSIQGIIQTGFKINNVKMSSLPFIKGNASKIFDNFNLTTADFSYSNKSGTIFSKKVDAGFEIKGKCKIAAGTADFYLKHNPNEKFTYFTTHIKDSGLKNILVLPEKDKRLIPDFKIINTTFIYSSAKRKFNNVDLEPGFIIKGKVKIGNSYSVIDLYHNTENNFLYLNTYLSSAKLGNYLPSFLKRGKAGSFFNKTRLFRTRFIYANQTGVYNNKKIEQGIKLTGNLAIGNARGIFSFYYSNNDNIYEFNSTFNRFNFSGIDLFSNDVVSIVSSLNLRKTTIKIVNKTGILYSRKVEQGIFINSEMVLSNVRTKAEIYYNQSNRFFYLNTYFNRASLYNVILPGIEIRIPNDIKNYLNSVYTRQVHLSYANKTGIYKGQRIEAGLNTRGKLYLGNLETRFKSIYKKDNGLYYLNIKARRFEPSTFSILPNSARQILHNFRMYNTVITYSNKNTNIEGKHVDKGFKITGRSIIQHISGNFELFYEPEKRFAYVKTSFPNTSLYDLISSVIPYNLPSFIANFGHSIRLHNALFEFANKSGMYNGKMIKAGIKSSGTAYISNVSGKFKLDYLKSNRLFYLNIFINKLSLGAISFIPKEAKDFANHIYLENARIIYSNKSGIVEGKNIKGGISITGQGHVGRIKSDFDIEYDNSTKILYVETKINRALLSDINVFAHSSWMPEEINNLARKSGIFNTTLKYANKSGFVKGKRVQKGLKAKGQLELFGKKADFELAHLSDSGLYYLNTTVYNVSLYDVNIFRAATILPSQIRNFGKNVIVKRANFTYANKRALLDNRLINPGFVLKGDMRLWNKNATIDLRYLKATSLFGFEFTLNNITLNDINIIKKLVTLPQSVVNFTKKISLNNIVIKYGNKSGRISGKKIKQGFSIAGDARAGSKTGDLLFLYSPAKELFYFQLKIDHLSLNDLNFMKGIIKMPAVINQIGSYIAVKDLRIMYANRSGRIGMHIFKKGFMAFGLPDFSKIPGFGKLIKFLHLKDLHLNFDPDLGLCFNVKLNFLGELRNLLAKFFKLRLPDFNIKIAFDGFNLSFNIPLLKGFHFDLNINPLLGTRIKLLSMFLKIKLPIRGGLPQFDFDMKMKVKPSKWDKWLNFEPELVFDPETVSVEFKASMKDTWRHPFGVRVGNIMIKDVAFEIGINLLTGEPDDFGFICKELDFFGEKVGGMIKCSAVDKVVLFGFKINKLDLKNFSILTRFLPSKFFDKLVSIRNVEIKIAPFGGRIGNINISPGITFKCDSARFGPFSGSLDIHTGGLTSFSGYIKATFKSGLDKLEKKILHKVRGIPLLRPILGKILSTFGIDYMKLNINASITKAEMKLDLGIKVLGKHHHIKIDIAFDPLELAIKIVEKLEHILGDVLAKIWNALKNAVITVGKDIKKAAVKSYHAVTHFFTHTVGHYISAVSDYVKRVAYSIWKRIKKWTWKVWKWVSHWIRKKVTKHKYVKVHFDYKKRLAKMKQWAHKLNNMINKEAVKYFNQFYKNVKPKITNFAGKPLKEIIQPEFTKLVKMFVGRFHHIHISTQAEDFFKSPDKAKGLKIYRKMVTSSFNILKNWIVKTFNAKFKEKPAVLELTNKKALKTLFAGF